MLDAIGDTVCRFFQSGDLPCGATAGGHGPTHQRHHPRRRRRRHAPQAFYEALGWKLTFTDGDIVMFQAGPMIVSLWGRGKLAEDSGISKDPGGWGGFTLGYAVAGTHGRRRVCADASVAGATITRAPVDKPFGYSGVFADPDGHTWEVAYIEALDSPRRRNGGDAVMRWKSSHDYCMSLPGATETFPFEPGVSVFKAPSRKDVRDHGGGQRSRSTSASSATPTSARRCAPSTSRSCPGYHLNKRHWITVTLGGDVPDERVRELVARQLRARRQAGRFEVAPEDRRSSTARSSGAEWEALDAEREAPERAVAGLGDVEVGPAEAAVRHHPVAAHQLVDDLRRPRRRCTQWAYVEATYSAAVGADAEAVGRSGGRAAR